MTRCIPSPWRDADQTRDTLPGRQLFAMSPARKRADYFDARLRRSPAGFRIFSITDTNLDVAPHDLPHSLPLAAPIVSGSFRCRATKCGERRHRFQTGSTFPGRSPSLRLDNGAVHGTGEFSRRPGLTAERSESLASVLQCRDIDYDFDRFTAVAGWCYCSLVTFQTTRL